MIRRAFLAYGLMLAGFSRRAWAQLTNTSQRYARLSSPVRIPIDAVTVPWRPVPFTGEAIAPQPGGAGRRVLLSGVLFRRVAGDARPALTALCLTCTHEQCQVDFVAEPTKLPRMDRVTTGPVFLCACHSSVFDAAEDGAWIAGPAPRGLFRFRLSLNDATVEINEVEEDALSAV